MIKNTPIISSCNDHLLKKSCKFLDVINKRNNLIIDPSQGRPNCGFFEAEIKH